MNVDIMETDARVKQSTRIYNKASLFLYDVYVHKFATPFLFKCDEKLIHDHYDKNISQNHLDVGVGTGYLIRKSKRAKSIARLGIMDVSEECLKKSEKTLKGLITDSYLANILEPFEINGEPYDSIGVNFVLHCVPGGFEEKGVAFSNLKQHLSPNGVLFGCTVLAKGVDISFGGQRLLDLYHHQGIFNNQNDSPESLEKALSKVFKHVDVNVVGNVAFFRASDTISS